MAMVNAAPVPGAAPAPSPRAGRAAYCGVAGAGEAPRGLFTLTRPSRRNLLLRVRALLGSGAAATGRRLGGHLAERRQVFGLDLRRLAILAADRVVDFLAV